MLIRMKTPLTVYSTDYDTKRTYFYSPEEPEFYQKIVDNFRRKYEAFYGVRSFQPITLTYIGEKLPQKLVISMPGTEPISFPENENIWIFCIRQDWDQKMRRDLACLR